MQSAHNGYYKGSIPFGLNNFILKENYISIFINIKNLKGIWSSLVYGTCLENKNFIKVVSSNLTVPV